MDYGTYFFTNIVSVTVFALSAWHNRSVIGMRWFAGALVAGWVKLIFQGIEGNAPAILRGMVANELYLVSFTMQMVGLHWFVVRKPFRYSWVFAALGLVAVIYTIFFVTKIPYGESDQHPFRDGLRRLRVDAAPLIQRAVPGRCAHGSHGAHR